MRKNYFLLLSALLLVALVYPQSAHSKKIKYSSFVVYDGEVVKKNKDNIPFGIGELQILYNSNSMCVIKGTFDDRIVKNATITIGARPDYYHWEYILSGDCEFKIIDNNQTVKIEMDQASLIDFKVTKLETDFRNRTSYANHLEQGISKPDIISPEKVKNVEINITVGKSEVEAFCWADSKEIITSDTRQINTKERLEKIKIAVEHPIDLKIQMDLTRRRRMEEDPSRYNDKVIEIKNSEEIKCNDVVYNCSINTDKNYPIVYYNETGFADFENKTVLLKSGEGQWLFMKDYNTGYNIKEMPVHIMTNVPKEVSDGWLSRLSLSDEDCYKYDSFYGTIMTKKEIDDIDRYFDPERYNLGAFKSWDELYERITSNVMRINDQSMFYYNAFDIIPLLFLPVDQRMNNIYYRTSSPMPNEYNQGNLYLSGLSDEQLDEKMTGIKSALLSFLGEKEADIVEAEKYKKQHGFDIKYKKVAEKYGDTMVKKYLNTSGYVCVGLSMQFHFDIVDALNEAKKKKAMQNGTTEFGVPYPKFVRKWQEANYSWELYTWDIDGYSYRIWVRNKNVHDYSVE